MDHRASLVHRSDIPPNIHISDDEAVEAFLPDRNRLAEHYNYDQSFDHFNSPSDEISNE